MRPAFITMQRSHSERIASITCSTITMVRPASRSERDQRDALAELGRIEAGEPLVEQQHSGRERQGARQLEALLVDVGELRRGDVRLAAEARRARAARRARGPRPAPHDGDRAEREDRQPRSRRTLIEPEHAHQLEGARHAEAGDAMRRQGGEVVRA